MKKLALGSFHLRNFKAVRDSKKIEFTPLTVFIGNNGSGKSSIIEGLEMLHTLVTVDLDEAVRPWRDFSHILNKAVSHELKGNSKTDSRSSYTNPMSFDLRGRLEDKFDVTYTLEITAGEAFNEIFIKQEMLRQKGRNVPTADFYRNDSGLVTGTYTIDEVKEAVDTKLQDGISLLNLSAYRFPYELPLRTFIQNWQFVTLVPQKMGDPRRQKRASGRIKLEKDGSNIGEYLAEIRDQDQGTFDEIVATLQRVLPYSEDLQIAVTSELERSVYPQISEENFKVPGWLLSTGTLRILALLALLRHPTPPPLIIIEEIENGLDPRSVALIINEIREAVESGKTQIIMTTHSPYLLDWLLLDHIVLVERADNGPVFSRPGDDEKLQQWAADFSKGSLGTLYATGRLNRRGGK